MIKLLTCIQEEHQQVKRKLKTMDEVMQSCNEPAKHRTYHVPPGKDWAAKKVTIFNLIVPLVKTSENI
jgi:hypothetical protein